ncbi:MAG: alkyl hydroperoxide reductase subunit F [Proteobacteria bacterium]|nr:alkyl hydroperoxide reductase subunit F [Pseudomonadota bacterium]
MLTREIKDTLGKHFAKLDAAVMLVAKSSLSEHQSLLEELLSETASTHERVQYRLSEEVSDLPYFSIHRDDGPTGIAFCGLPTGHEFSSLVLAILHVDLKGQLPDEHIQQRIRSLKGERHFRTYISLSCSNCPLIVQAMNLIASLHPSISHTMVDGGMAEEEFQRLGSSSVPAVYDGSTLVHAGRATLAELLAKLEKHLGVVEREPVSFEQKAYDMVVVGGGPAGVSAAIYAARKGMKTAIVAEALGGQLNETQGIENFVSVIYTQGAQLAGQMVNHLREYPVDILEHRLVSSLSSVSDQSEKKILTLTSGEVVTATRVIIATGARWRELGVEGEKRYLGKGVAYCPHCDGPYFKGKDVIVVGGGNSGVEAAIDLSGMVKSVTLFEFCDELKADRVLVDVLKGRKNTSIMTSVALRTVEGDGKMVTGVRYLDRNSEEVKELKTSAVFVQIGLLPNSQFLKGSVDLSEHGEVVVDEKNRTSMKGVYATGDVTTIPYKQIIISMGDGAKAALAAFEDSILG